jgi:hypothetical protein
MQRRERAQKRELLFKNVGTQAQREFGKHESEERQRAQEIRGQLPRGQWKHQQWSRFEQFAKQSWRNIGETGQFASSKLFGLTLDSFIYSTVYSDFRSKDELIRVRAMLEQSQLMRKCELDKMEQLQNKLNLLSNVSYN